MRRNESFFVSLLAALALALLIGPSAALAFPAHGGKGFGHRGGVFQMLQTHRADLDLTDEQVEQLEALQDRQRQSQREQRESFRTEKRALRDLLEADEMDRAAADRRIDTLAEQMAKLHRARMSAMLDAREILTPEQRDKLRELRRAKREAWKDRHGEAPPSP
jgi:Spy/CpxP family protein refolding chaperone